MTVVADLTSWQQLASIGVHPDQVPCRVMGFILV